MRSWRTFVGAWLVFFVLSAAWAMSNPIAASPDEPAHIVKAASVVRGQLDGPQSEYGMVVQVPSYVQFTFAQTCFAFEPDVSASCSPGQPPGDPFQTVDAATTAGLYNPVYYALVGWPTLLVQDSTGVYLMRLVNAALCSLFLALSFSMIAKWRKPTVALLGFTVAVTPMVLFLNSSVNPNGLETVTVLAAFVGMLGVVLHPRRDLLFGRSMVVLVASAIAVNTRGLSPVWVAVAVLVPLILLRKDAFVDLIRRRPVQIAVVGVAVATCLAVVWLLRSNSLGAAIENPSEALEAPSVGASATSGFLATLDQTFGLGLNMIGIFGWLDTLAPQVVFFLWSVFTGALTIGSLVLLRGRRLALAITLIVCVLLLPPLVQGAYITGGGFIWQGRYTLPIFVCLLVGLSALIADRLPASNSGALARLSILVVVAWACAHLYSLLVNLKRYVAGADSTWADVLLRPEWAPPGGVVLWPAVFGVTIAAASALLIVSALRAPAADSDPEPAEEPVVRARAN